MRLYLNYIFPDGQVVWGDKPVNTDFVGYNSWLDAMVRPNPDVIFFYTTASTDIF